jgi:predicted nucleic acid-binding protein
MSKKAIVLDANILIRAVLGKRVRELILAHAANVKFVAPDAAYADARKYLPELLAKRGISSVTGNEVLISLEAAVLPVAFDFYAANQQQALRRIAARDADDWPVLACAMTLHCPVWTEDADFFGSGVATWTTDRVELYLNADK